MCITLAANTAKLFYDKDGVDKEGYDKGGYDVTGYNRDGYDSLGYHENGGDKDGVRKEGLHREWLRRGHPYQPSFSAMCFHSSPKLMPNSEALYNFVWCVHSAMY